MAAILDALDTSMHILPMSTIGQLRLHSSLHFFGLHLSSLMLLKGARRGQVRSAISKKHGNRHHQPHHTRGRRSGGAEEAQCARSERIKCGCKRGVHTHMAIRWFSTWSWPSALGLADIATAGPQEAEKAEEKQNKHGKETKSNY